VCDNKKTYIVFQVSGSASADEEEDSDSALDHYELETSQVNHFIYRSLYLKYNCILYVFYVVNAFLSRLRKNCFHLLLCLFNFIYFSFFFSFLGRCTAVPGEFG